MDGTIPPQNRRLLFPYQGAAVREVVGHVADIAYLGNPERTVVLQAPTGSGKTTMILTVVQHLLDAGVYDTVLVLTSFGDVRDSFRRAALENIVPGFDNFQEMVIDCRSQVRSANTDVIAQIEQHLTDPPRERHRVLVATHQAGVRFFRSRAGDLRGINWARVILVIDEAHHVTVHYEDQERDDHSKETDIGKMTQAARESGALVLMTTATPHRSNTEERVYPEEARLTLVPYEDVVEQAGAPAELRIELVGRDDMHALDMTVSTLRQMEGDSTQWTSGDFGVLSDHDATQVAAKIVRDGRQRSKCLLRIGRLHMTEDNGDVVSSGNVERLTIALKQAWPGVRVFDATGDRAVEFSEQLRIEGAVTRFADSKIDVFIVSGRGIEGTDWPLCSHIYNVGLCHSIPRTQQMLGRGMRSKREYADYPDEFRNIVTLTFFVPRMSEKLDTLVREKWHANTLLVACFIHSHEVAREFMGHVDTTIRTSRGDGLSERIWRQFHSAYLHARPSEPELARGAQIVTGLEMSLRAQHGRDPTVSEVVRACTNHPGLTLKERLAATMAALHGGGADERAQVKGELSKVLRRFVRTFLDGDSIQQRQERPRVDEVLLGLFQEVAAKFDHLTSVRHQGAVEVVSTIFSEHPRAIADELRLKIVERPPYEQVIRVVLWWYSNHRGQRIDGDLSAAFGFPPNTYGKTTLEKDLKERRIPGQDPAVNSLTDLLMVLRC